MLNLRPHDYALLFPAMGEQDYAELKTSMNNTGQVEEIVLLDGKILDGVHRHKACKELGIEARFVNWDDLPETIKKIGPLAYVYAKNVPRRHLTTEQRVKLALELLPRLRQEAKERQLSGERASSDAKGKAAEKAAAAVGVSTSTVERASRKERKQREPEQSPDRDRDGDKPTQPAEVGEVFTLLRRLKTLVKSFPADVSLGTVDRLIRGWEILRDTIYKLRAPDKGEPMTDDSLMPFGRYKGKPMRNVPDDYLQWWLNEHSNREEIETDAATYDYKQRAIALRNLKVWDYATTRSLAMKNGRRRWSQQRRRRSTSTSSTSKKWDSRTSRIATKNSSYKV